MRTLIIILAILLFIRLVIRYVLPVFVSKKFREMEEKMRNQQHQDTKSSRKENDVTLEYKQRQQPQESQFKDKGEYVDFEEVE